MWLAVESSLLFSADSKLALHRPIAGSMLMVQTIATQQYHKERFAVLGQYFGNRGLSSDDGGPCPDQNGNTHRAVMTPTTHGG